MKIVEIKGLWGLIGFLCMMGLLIGLLALVPVAVTWISWNAIVGELLNGPMIQFWQSLILTAALLLGFYIVFRPHVAFEIKRVQHKDDIETHLKSIKKDRKQ